MLSWDDSIKRFSREHGTIVNIGPVDTGKTSWIAEVLHRRQEKQIGIISGDLGQVTFGAPGLLSAALVNPDVESLTDIQPDRVFFVGKNQPGGRFLQTIQGLNRLTTWLRFRSDTIYVDTDGFVTGPAAREYKRILLSHLQPCTVIFFGDSPDLVPLLTWCQSQNDIAAAQVTVPSGVQIKTAQQRQRYRLSRLHSWFRNAG
ncbi:MAG TPA: Clp1/GlmU family protein, partial [bacterium]|nr:Clp1/GlmU family protein [bacterium]